jgi:NADH-quinone oxidoreductase subunit F
MDAEATAAERHAVDARLGPPEGAWDGGTRRGLDGRVAYGGFHAAAAVRHLLLPALHAVQNAVGWISPGALNYVCERLGVPPAEAYGVATFYSLLATEPRPSLVAHVCGDVACRLAGAERVMEDLAEEFGDEGVERDDALWVRSPCLGRCEAGPAVFLQHAGGRPVEIAPVAAADVMAAFGGRPPAGPPPGSALPQPAARLLRRVASIDRSLAAYRASGGYDGLAAAMERGAAETIAELRTSLLRGRGGAAFPVAAKWAAAAAGAAPRYVVCNADESEPGTFKDRVLLESDPFAVVEGLTIAGFAVGAEQGYVYVRGEYVQATAELEQALEAARAAGLLGGGFGFDIEVRRGAGAYICGEETALFNSIEGCRGEPRQKPPYPTESGLFGRPTVVNNVETLANVPWIMANGAAAFAATGTAESTGTKLFSLSGHVTRPGVYEVEFGTTLREVLVLGGVDWDRLRAVLLGGAAGAFTDAWDLPLTFEATSARGLSLGSGAIVVFDADSDFPAVVQRIAAFLRDESCGQCVPCRVGTVRQEEALVRLNGGHEGEVRLLADIERVMRDASICGLGQTAGNAVQSAIRLGLIGREQ